MPSCSEAHRRSIGRFHPVLIHILWRKVCFKFKPPRHGLPTDPRHIVRNTKSELFCLLVSVTLSVAYCLSVVLLAQCMDVEQNPGPSCDNSCQSFIQKAQDCIERRFSQILHCLSKQNTDLLTKMEENHRRLERTFTEIKDELNRQSEDICNNRNDIEAATSRIDDLEREIDRLETFSRLANMKFFGIQEEKNEDSRSLIDKVIDILNRVSATRIWRHGDIDRAYRVGRFQRRSQPRPTIVCFRHSDDKVFILRDKVLRDHLKNKGIKVSADLTPRQQAQVQFYRDQGKHAYYKNGRLHIDHNHSRFNYNTQTRTHDQNDERYNNSQNHRQNLNRSSGSGQIHHPNEEYHSYQQTHKTDNKHRKSQNHDYHMDQLHSYRDRRRNIEGEKYYQPEEMNHASHDQSLPQDDNRPTSTNNWGDRREQQQQLYETQDWGDGQDTQSHYPFPQDYTDLNWDTLPYPPAFAAPPSYSWYSNCYPTTSYSSYSNGNLHPIQAAAVELACNPGPVHPQSNPLIVISPTPDRHTETAHSSHMADPSAKHHGSLKAPAPAADPTLPHSEKSVDTTHTAPPPTPQPADEHTPLIHEEDPPSVSSDLPSSQGTDKHVAAVEETVDTIEQIRPANETTNLSASEDHNTTGDTPAHQREENMQQQQQQQQQSSHRTSADTEVDPRNYAEVVKSPPREKSVSAHQMKTRQTAARTPQRTAGESPTAARASRPAKKPVSKTKQTIGTRQDSASQKTRSTSQSSRQTNLDGWKTVNDPDSQK